MDKKTLNIIQFIIIIILGLNLVIQWNIKNKQTDIFERINVVEDVVNNTDNVLHLHCGDECIKQMCLDKKERAKLLLDNTGVAVIINIEDCYEFNIE